MRDQAALEVRPSNQCSLWLRFGDAVSGKIFRAPAGEFTAEHSEAWAGHFGNTHARFGTLACVEYAQRGELALLGSHCTETPRVKTDRTFLAGDTRTWIAQPLFRDTELVDVRSRIAETCPSAAMHKTFRWFPHSLHRWRFDPRQQVCSGMR